MLHGTIMVIEFLLNAIWTKRVVTAFFPTTFLVLSDNNRATLLQT